MVVGDAPKRSARVRFADDDIDDFGVTSTPRLQSVQESNREVSSCETASQDTIPPESLRLPKRPSPAQYPARQMVEYETSLADEQPTLTVAPKQRRRCSRCDFGVVLLAIFLITVAVVVGVELGISHRPHPSSGSGGGGGGGGNSASSLATDAAGTILHNATHGLLDLNATNNSPPKVTVNPPKVGSRNATTDKTNTTTIESIGQSLRNRFHHSHSPTAAPTKAPSFQ